MTTPQAQTCRKRKRRPTTQNEAGMGNEICAAANRGHRQDAVFAPHASHAPATDSDTGNLTE